MVQHMGAVQEELQGIASASAGSLLAERDRHFLLGMKIYGPNAIVIRRMPANGCGAVVK